MNFASDNVTGAAPRVIEALTRLNEGPQPAYGLDAPTREAERLLADLFERDVVVQLVATGTAANALALAALTPPWGAVLCHEEAHITDDECGAPEFFTHGAKLAGVPGAGGKITPDALRHGLTRFPRGAVKSVQPTALSISQVTEAGTIYSLAELGALTEVVRVEGLRVHMDGARFANAIVALGCTPAQMTWQAGIDVLTLGLTKVGALACEAIVFFDAALAENMQYRRKRAGHTLSKGRLLGIQAGALLRDGHLFDLARHANAMAARLAAGLSGIGGVRLAWPVEANEVFPILPERIDAALRAEGFAYHAWASGSLAPGDGIGPDERFIRLVTSFETKATDVERLIETARRAAQAQAA